MSQPLATKLGIGDGATVALVAAPPDVVADLTAELPAGTHLKRQVRGRADVVVAFFTQRGELERRVERLAEMVFPAGALWVAWPKQASKVETDMSDGAIREVVLPLGLVDNKVCAIDATWSGLRVVWRRERRLPGGAGEAGTGGAASDSP